MQLIENLALKTTIDPLLKSW